MAKSKPSTRKKPVYGKIKDPVKPKWMRVTRFITIILLSIFMLMALVEYMIRYYRLISNHK